MSVSEQTGEEGSSHAAAAEHPLAAYEWLASRVLSCIDEPREVCRLALVNKAFYEASLSDPVWEKRLPPLQHLSAIFSNAILKPLLHLSKKDLYLKLCSSLVYDGGLKRFWIDPASGRGCYMISARALSICGGNIPSYWRWTPWPGAMFEEVAYLKTFCWFDISGVFRQVLKPGNYLVSFRMLLWSSWGGTPVKLSLEDTASAYAPRLSEVFFDGKTKFKRRRCIPFVQTLKPKNVAHVTNDVEQSDHGQDATDIVEGGTDGDVNDDRHDGKLSLEDAASAYSRHLSEVFFDERTHFTRGRLPFLQILEPETVAHLIYDGGQLDQGRDGTDICEERTDGDGNAEGDDGSADRINGRDNHDNCANDVDGGADTSGDRDDHDDGDYNKCEEGDDEDRDDDDDDDDYYQSIQHPFVSPRDIEKQHTHNDHSCKNDDGGGAHGSGDSDKHDNDNDSKYEDDGDEDSNGYDDDDDDQNLLYPFLLPRYIEGQHTHNNNADIHEWLECDIGQFTVQDHNKEKPVDIKFRMQEIVQPWWKSGFVLDGVIIRPAIVAEMAELE